MLYQWICLCLIHCICTHTHTVQTRNWYKTVLFYLYFAVLFGQENKQKRQWTQTETQYFSGFVNKPKCGPACKDSVFFLELYNLYGIVHYITWVYTTFSQHLIDASHESSKKKLSFIGFGILIFVI